MGLETRECDDLMTLGNDQWTAFLRTQFPSVLGYRYRKNNMILGGRVSQDSPELAISSGNSLMSPEDYDVVYNTIQQDGSICYLGKVDSMGELLVEFCLIYTLTEDGLRIVMKDIKEYGDYHFIHIRLPEVVTVLGDEQDGKLILPTFGGRLVDVGKSDIQEKRHPYNYINTSMIAMATRGNLLAILESESVENELISKVFSNNGHKYGSLGILMRYRFFEWDFSEYGHRVAAAGPDYHLKLQDHSTATVILVGNPDCNVRVDWTDGAKCIRERMNLKINPYYSNKLVFKVINEIANGTQCMTFSQTLDMIEKIAFLTDNHPAVYYLVGWQYLGHDTGYPAVDKVNERLGGYIELMKLMEEAKKYNAVVSFHDNYDDAYVQSPDWDPEMISRDASGELMKTGCFIWGQAYLLSNLKYAQNQAICRVRQTINQYKIIETYHIDVMSGGFFCGRRYDFNPTSPSASMDNLKGKQMVIDEFNRHGIDVTTEDFGTLLLGSVGHYWNILCLERDCYSSEQAIPLIPFIYHGLVSYGAACTTNRDKLLCLLNGSVPSAEFVLDDWKQYVACAYLVAFPMERFFGKRIVKYDHHGDIQRITYEDGGYVEVDLSREKYCIVTGGCIISKNFTTFLPSPKGDAYLGYSHFGGEFHYPKPSNFGISVKVYALQDDGHERQIPCRIENGELIFDTVAEGIYRCVSNDDNE